MKHMKTMARTLILLLAAALLLGGVPQSAQAAGFAAIITSSGMRVFADSAMTRSLGTLAKGEIVTVSAYSGDVAAVTYNGTSGFAAVSDMSRISDVCEKAKINRSGARVYESMNTAARSIALKKGFTVYLVDVDGKWARVAAGSRVGYTNIDWLTVAKAEPTPTVAPTVAPEATPGANWLTAVVSANSARVYTSPSTASKMLATLKKGVEVNVLDYTKNWAHIEKNGYYGYCATKALKKTAAAATPTPAPTPTPASAWTPAVVTVDSVKVYATESADSACLGTLKKGAQVNIVSYNVSWAHIEMNGNYGYCATFALAKDDEEEPAPTPGATDSARDVIPATVKASSVKVYASASTRSKSLGTLKRGAQVNVVEANSTWAYIELNGKYGFCKRSALVRTSDIEPEATPGLQVKAKATVIYPNMPVYRKNNTDSVVMTLPIGSTVDVYASDDTWAMIGNDGPSGFTLVKYLSAETYAELTAGDTGDSVLNLQKALEALGYFDGVPGSNYSTLTTEAVKRFQAAVGLTQTGTADQLTLRILVGGYAPASPILSATLSKGSQGTNVTRLQTRLLAKGYLSKSGSVDGDYGSITVSAVKLFQKKAGLSETGTADSETIRALFKSGAPSLGSGTPADKAASTDTGDKTAPKDSGDTPGKNSKIETVITAAKNQLGKPYVYGAMGPNSFDCSGLTSYAFKQVGISLNRTAYAQGYNDGEKISGLSNLVRGDIVCMNTISDSDLSDHVGIYLGGGQMIHASSGGGKVMISSLTSGYYNRVFSWGRRIIK